MHRPHSLIHACPPLTATPAHGRHAVSALHEGMSPSESNSSLLVARVGPHGGLECSFNAAQTSGGGLGSLPSGVGRGGWSRGFREPQDGIAPEALNMEIFVPPCRRGSVLSTKSQKGLPWFPPFPPQLSPAARTAAVGGISCQHLYPPGPQTPGATDTSAGAGHHHPSPWEISARTCEAGAL